MTDTKYTDAVTAIPIGGVAVDQVALVGCCEIFDRDALAAVLVGSILHHSISVGEGADLDAGAKRTAGIVGFDAVIVGLIQRDSAGVGAHIIAAQQVIVCK